MVILGIHGDLFNKQRTVFESNAAIVADGRLVAAVSEERLSRKKLDGCFPDRAIEEVMNLSGYAPGEVAAVVFGSRKPIHSIKGYIRSTASTFIDTGVMVANPRKAGKLLKGMLNKAAGKKATAHDRSEQRFGDAVFYDHHLCHAAGAYYASPFDEALVITLDGGGDGLDGSVYTARGAALRRVNTIPHFQSPGTMYSAITHDLGFTRHRHEGKITGLAAYGNPEKALKRVNHLIRYDRHKHRFISPQIARHHRDLNQRSAYFGPLLNEYSKEDVSSTVQYLFEKVILEFADDAYGMAGLKDKINLCLAGGCFANVRLNQKLLELPFVKNVFVFPAMGDGGLGAGAALLHYYKSNRRAAKVTTGEHMYLGRNFSDSEAEQALRTAGLGFDKPGDPEGEVARLLAEGKVIGRCNGAMEYGPRALGNRSILGAPFDASINDWLNKKLHRTEFMPFAPSVTAEAAARLFEGYRDEDVAADFMTITYGVKQEIRDKIPAVVHVDHTARPQVVRQHINPSFHAIISKFGGLTGIPVVLNTSFNIHEEPIVCTPADAIRGFLDARLDYLSLGPFLCKLPG